MRRYSFWILSVFFFSLFYLKAEAYLYPDEPCGVMQGISQYVTNPQMGGVPDSGRMDFERALWSPVPGAENTYQPNVTGTAIAPASRLCFDPQGDVYEERAWAWNTNAGWIDFDWCDEFSDPASCAFLVPSMNLEMVVPVNAPQVNRYAYWSGYAWSDNIGWIQFDWNCSGCDLTQRVHTQLPNGWPDDLTFTPHSNIWAEVDGYAWNDRIGWINFGHTTMTAGPGQALPFEETINVLPEVTLTPDPADVTKYGLGGGLQPVLADGDDAYVLSVKLFDVDNGVYLDGNYDVDVTVTPTADSHVGTDQIVAVGPDYAQPWLVRRGVTSPYALESRWIPSVPEWQARNYDAVFLEDPVYNSATQAFEVEIKSWAPTSNINGADDNGDGTIDRYFDQDPVTSLISTDRNKWAIESIDIVVNSGPQEVALNASAAPLWGLDTAVPGNPLDLKFAPPVEVTNIAYVDTYDYDEDGENDDLLSYIPSFTPTEVPYTHPFSFEGLAALWSSALQTLPGLGLQFGVHSLLGTLDADPQGTPFVWTFGFQNMNPNVNPLAVGPLQLRGGFNNFLSQTSIPTSFKWYSAPPPALNLNQALYRAFLSSIMGSTGFNNFNGSTSGVSTDYSARSSQYVPPLASSVGFEPFSEAAPYAQNACSSSNTYASFGPCNNYNLESTVVVFCSSCPNYGMTITDYAPTVLPQFSYDTWIEYDAYLGLDTNGDEIYSKIRYRSNGVPSVGSLAPSPYVYDVPVPDADCPGCSGSGAPGAPGAGGGTPQLDGTPTLTADDGLRLPAEIVGSISGSSVSSSGTTVVGAASRTKIRNQIYKRFSQLKKGVNLVESSSSSGMNEVSVEDADGDGEAEFVAPTDGCTLLLDGSLVYCLGDTQLSVPDGDYPQATVVVEGGNLYATTDIVGADRDALGLVVFEDMTGVGGTIYIDKEVTDLVRVNIYSDGSVQSYDASSPLDPTPWADLAGRSDALTNQLYIGGSVVSANTVGGLATLYYANDPATTEEQLFDAAEQDLNNFREFQVCWFAVEADPVTGEAAVPIVPVDYDLDGSWWDALQGAPDAGDVTSCGADYGRSATLDALGPSNNEPLRLEYIKPPSGLPLLGGL